MSRVESWLGQSIPPALLDLAGTVPPFREAVAHLHENAGRLRRAARVMGQGTSPYAQRMRGLVEALDRGGLGGIDAPAGETPPERVPFNRQALMVLYGSPPWLDNGYTVRTRCLLDGLERQGIACTAVTRPNFPRDLAAFRNVDAASYGDVDGRRYEPLASAETMWEGPLDAYIRAFADRLAALARQRGASVIHAASNHVCGLAAALAAERVGARSVYEIRGLWHWSTMHRRPGWEHSETFALHEALERQAALRADRVVVLSEALADHVRGWGIPAASIRCVGNGVDVDRFAPQPRDDAMRAGWGATPRSFVLGFVGTFAPYEGLDVLLEATALLLKRGIDARAVLIGSGESEARLRDLSRRLDVPVHFGARVPYVEVPRTLAAMDCCPFPRERFGAASLVPPLKLGEAMACAVPVLVADIPPLTEMVRDGATGRVVGAGASALADGLERTWRDGDGSRRMAAAARHWMTENRSWDHLVGRLAELWND